MKNIKITIVTLIFSISINLVYSQNWLKSTSYDDFGDPKDDVAFKAINEGFFSNSATTGSSCEVITFLSENSNGKYAGLPNFSFMVLTYGDNPASPINSELCPVYFKKENGEKFQIAFYYSSSGRAYIEPHIYNYDVLMKSLLEDNFVKMNFTVDNAHFKAKITGIGFTKSFNSYNPEGLDLDIQRSPSMDYKK